MSFRYTSEDVN